MQPFSITVNEEITPSAIQRGLFLVIIEAKRIPPHIGVMINGNFSSLTIKGHELNVSSSVLLKNISLRKIPSLFIKILDHPVFSSAYLDELLQSCIIDHDRVEVNGPTCLFPIRQFFKEGYHVDTKETEYIFHLLPLLIRNGLVVSVYGSNLDIDLRKENFLLPYYTKNEIYGRIEAVRKEVRA
jgi:hypothetical protein